LNVIVSSQSGGRSYADAPVSTVRSYAHGCYMWFDEWRQIAILIAPRWLLRSKSIDLRLSAQGRSSDWLLFMATPVTSRLIPTRSGDRWISTGFPGRIGSRVASLFCLCRRPNCNTSPETNERQAEAGRAASALAQSPEVVA